MRNRWGWLGTLATYAVVLLFVIPALWMVVTGFKTEGQAYTMPPSLWFHPTLHQFSLAFAGGFLSYLAHSASAALISTALAFALGIPAAYAMVFHLKAKSADNMLFFVLSTRFMPFAAIIVPLYILFTRVHLLDTVTGLVIVYTSMNLPLVVWMARSYFLDLPEEVVEASRIDGCTPWQSLFRIVLPMTSSGIAATAILAIIFAWNDFFFAVNLTFTRAPTLPIMVSSFMSNESLFLAKVSGLATLIVVVPVALGLYAQRHLVRGLTAGALK